MLENPGDHVDMQIIQEAKTSALHYKGIDPNHIGKMINFGNNHLVLEYQEEDPQTRTMVKKVIKMPRIGKEHNTPTYEEELADYRELENNPNCPIKPVKARIIKADNTVDGKTYCCVVQDRVQFKNLTPEFLLRDPELKRQFEELLVFNRKLVEDKDISIDFFGLKGAQESSKALLIKMAGGLATGFLDDTGQNYPDTQLIPNPEVAESNITNVVVATDEKGRQRLTIIDYGLFRMKKEKQETKEQRFQRAMYTVSYELNRQLMKRLFGDYTKNLTTFKNPEDAFVNADIGKRFLLNPADIFLLVKEYTPLILKFIQNNFTSKV